MRAEWGTAKHGHWQCHARQLPRPCDKDQTRRRLAPNINEFDAFLECGLLAHGLLRLHCGDCGDDKLVAFSCKRRGFCPSCGARRMARTAAHLVDHVIPHVPVRQWVLSLAIPLRLLLATAQAGDAGAAGGAPHDHAPPARPGRAQA